MELGTCDAALQIVLSYGGVLLHEPLKSRRVTLANSLTFAVPGVPIA